MLPYAAGGILLGTAIATVPALVSPTPGFLVRWVLPVLGAAAGFAAGLALFLAAAAEKLVASLAALVPGMGAAAILERRIRGTASGPARALRLTAAMVMAGIAVVSALAVFLGS